ncbi:MAG TPA: hypothetical protein VI136_22990 [Verrucomicrobiae bacterium]
MRTQVHIFKSSEAAQTFAEELEEKGWETEIDEVDICQVYDQEDPDNPELLYEARARRWVIHATKG